MYYFILFITIYTYVFAMQIVVYLTLRGRDPLVFICLKCRPFCGPLRPILCLIKDCILLDYEPYKLVLRFGKYSLNYNQGTLES